MECHGLHEYLHEWRAGLPQGNNKTAICVKKDTLSVAIRSSEENKRGDIVTLVMRIKGISFGKANK